MNKRTSFFRCVVVALLGDLASYTTVVCLQCDLGSACLAFKLLPPGLFWPATRPHRCRANRLLLQAAHDVVVRERRPGAGWISTSAGLVVVDGHTLGALPPRPASAEEKGRVSPALDSLGGAPPQSQVAFFPPFLSSFFSRSRVTLTLALRPSLSPSFWWI